MSTNQILTSCVLQSFPDILKKRRASGALRAERKVAWMLLRLRFFHSYCLPLVFWHLWFRAMASNPAFLFVSEALSLLYSRPGGGERNREIYQEWVCCEGWLCVFCLYPLELATLTVLKAAPAATRGRHPSSVFPGSSTKPRINGFSSQTTHFRHSQKTHKRRN